MDCIVHVVAKSRTRLSGFHILVQGPLPSYLDQLQTLIFQIRSLVPEGWEIGYSWGDTIQRMHIASFFAWLLYEVSFEKKLDHLLL